MYMTKEQLIEEFFTRNYIPSESNPDCESLATFQAKSKEDQNAEIAAWLLSKKAENEVRLDAIDAEYEAKKLAVSSYLVAENALIDTTIEEIT